VDNKWGQTRARPTNRGCNPTHLRGLLLVYGETLDGGTKPTPPIPASSSSSSPIGRAHRGGASPVRVLALHSSGRLSPSSLSHVSCLATSLSLSGRSLGRCGGEWQQIPGWRIGGRRRDGRQHSDGQSWCRVSPSSSFQCTCTLSSPSHFPLSTDQTTGVSLRIHRWRGDLMVGPPAIAARPGAVRRRFPCEYLGHLLSPAPPRAAAAVAWPHPSSRSLRTLLRLLPLWSSSHLNNLPLPFQQPPKRGQKSS
jgi:hypothetical protein